MLDIIIGIVADAAVSATDAAAVSNNSSIVITANTPITITTNTDRNWQYYYQEFCSITTSLFSVLEKVMELLKKSNRHFEICVGGWFAWYGQTVEINTRIQVTSDFVSVWIQPGNRSVFLSFSVIKFPPNAIDCGQRCPDKMFCHLTDLPQRPKFSCIVCNP